MSFNRDKYKKSVSIERIRKISEEENLSLRIGGYTNFLEISEGQNKFRIFPPKDADNSYAIARCVHWLPFPNEKGEVKKRPFYNAVRHGGQKRDLVEEYLNAVQRLVVNGEVENGEEILSKLKGNNNNYQSSITPRVSWILKALKLIGNPESSVEYGELEIGKSIRDQINSNAISISEDEDIDFDPYTDIDTGRPIIITLNSKKPGKDRYALTVSAKKRVLTDEELLTWERDKPLTENYGKNIYTIDNFEDVLTALKYLDETESIGVFEDDEWDSLVRSMRRELSQNSRKDFENEESGIQSSLNVLDRTELKTFIMDNNLDVKVSVKMTDDDIREEILKALNLNAEELKTDEINNVDDLKSKLSNFKK